MKRALLLAAPAVLVLGLVACGDDDDDAPDSTTADTEATTDDTASDETIADDSLGPDITIPDITIPDISIPDITIPDISIPDPTELLAQIFPKLDDDQIDCLADQIGSDVDASKAMELLDECNIDPADLAPGS